MKKPLILSGLFLVTAILSGCGKDPQPEPTPDPKPDPVCQHIDANHDHFCDKCSIRLSDCADNDNDHNCDVCGKKLTDHNVDPNTGYCTICGKEIIHIHKYEFISNDDATCTSNGTKTGTCECGDTITVTDMGSKRAHSFTKKDPSAKYLAYKGDCEHKDVYFYACNECGAIGSETYEFGEENSHKWQTATALGVDKVILTCETCGYTKADDRYKTLDVYATNDFHGNFTLDETKDENDLTKFGMYFKEKSELPNTLLLDQGDTWHGGYDSNSNFGALANEVMAYAGFDSRTVGNHDFNWGLEVLKTNTRSSHNGYRVPVLAANIYDYNFKTRQYGNVQQNEIGQEYVINVLENGLKVGIVGVIPEDQVFTISENLIHDIGFKNYVKTAKSICEKLRNDEGCDIVICSVHEGVANAKTRLACLTENMPGTSTKYCDLVVCSHTHKLEKEFVNDVLFFQNDAQLKNFRRVNIVYDVLEQKVLYDEVNDLVINNSNETYSNIDKDLLSIISKYKKNIVEQKRKIVHNNVTTDFTMEQGSYLLAKALSDEATRQGEKPDYTFVVRAKGAAKNEAGKYENAFNKGTLTYGSFFEGYASDYQVYTFSVKGSDVKALLEQGQGRMNKGMDNGLVALFCYKDNSAPGFDDIDESATYKVCAEDGLTFHTKYLRYGKPLEGYNEGSYDDSVEYTREYDYFRTIDFDSAKMIKRSNGDMYHYRDILENYLAKHVEPLDASNYSRGGNFLKGNDYTVK